MVSRQPATGDAKRKDSNVFPAQAADYANVKPRAPEHGGRFRVICSMVILLATVAVLIKCAEASYRDGANEDELDWDCQSYPCFCDGNFMKQCPAKGVCKNRRLPKYGDRIPIMYAEPQNNEFEPDHLEPKKWGRKRPVYALNGEETLDENGKVVVLQKVEVEEGEDPMDEIHLYPVHVKIPVKVDQSVAVMPPIKHKYKIKEYTTEEVKTETEMVPVMETVIKPVGLTEDQIVDSMTP